LPGHHGYEQLIVVLKKEQRWLEAERLATEAKSQGWAGEWDKIIAKCRQKQCL